MTFVIYDMSEVIVSIIIPMKNASAFVGQTLESVIAQTFTQWEAIIVDDNSTDHGKSVEVVNSFIRRDSRIQLVESKVSKGSSGSRNEALRRAKGKYISFLDSDDIWHPEFLETMIRYISGCQIPNAAIFYSGYRRMNDDCTISILPDFCCPGVIDFRRLLYNCPIFPSISIIDTTRVKEKFFFNEALKSLRDDYVFYLTILHSGYVAVGFDDILVDYRIRVDSMTFSKHRMIRPQWNVYRKVLGLSFVRSLYFLICWGLNGLKKYSKI